MEHFVRPRSYLGIVVSQYELWLLLPVFFFTQFLCANAYEAYLLRYRGIQADAVVTQSTYKSKAYTFTTKKGQEVYSFSNSKGKLSNQHIKIVYVASKPSINQIHWGYVSDSTERHTKKYGFEYAVGLATVMLMMTLYLLRKSFFYSARIYQLQRAEGVAKGRRIPCGPLRSFLDGVFSPIFMQYKYQFEVNSLIYFGSTSLFYNRKNQDHRFDLADMRILYDESNPKINCWEGELL